MFTQFSYPESECTLYTHGVSGVQKKPHGTCHSSSDDCIDLYRVSTQWLLLQIVMYKGDLFVDCLPYMLNHPLAIPIEN